MIKYVCIFYYFSILRYHRWSEPFLIEDMELRILHIESMDRFANTKRRKWLHLHKIMGVNQLNIST